MPPDQDLTRLYLVRHGATEANERVPYILQGNSIDLALSGRGECQARALATFLKRFPIAQVYTSKMCRAQQTADAIAREQSLVPTVVEDLHECDVGLWEGLDWETIARTHPDAHRRFVDDPAANPYLGGESYGQVLSRARPVLERLLDAHRGESICVVAHNVVNRVLLAEILGMDLRQAPKIPQGNGCVNLIKRTDGRNVLVTLNALFHLEGV